MLSIAARNQLNSVWNDALEDKFRKLWALGELSAAKIAAELGHGLSRSAVLGKANRLGLLGDKTREQHLRDRSEYQRIHRAIQSKRGTGAVTKLRYIARGQKQEGPRRAVVIDSNIPVAQRCHSIPDETKCHWPVGNPGEPGFFFCGSEDKHGGSSYCRYHHSIAYQPRVAA